MSPLGAALAERIGGDGPITVAEFMAAALGDPDSGYYMRRDPLGAAGDFVTAPEISQMFGELIGLWCIAAFEQMGAPSRLRLVELGPGRGSLMADLWRAAKIRPRFVAALSIHLVETSPALRRRQGEALPGLPVAWHESFAEAAAAEPGPPLIALANEFFDALPVHQLVRTDAGWRERTVDFDPGTERFRFAASPSPTPTCAFVPPALRDAPAGAIFEVSLQARAVIAEIAAEIVACGGAGLIFDYGHARSALGDTLQAVRAHRAHEVLDDPGTADITAHVDFEALAHAARASGAHVFGPVPQGDFLRRLGIEARAAALAGAAPGQRRAIEAARDRLIGARQMGRLFKVMAVTAPNLAAAGF